MIAKIKQATLRIMPSNEVGLKNKNSQRYKLQHLLLLESRINNKEMKENGY